MPGTSSSRQEDLQRALTIQREHSGAREQIVELQESALRTAGECVLSVPPVTQATVLVKANEHVTSEPDVAHGDSQGRDAISVSLGTSDSQKVVQLYQVPKHEQQILAHQLEQQPDPTVDQGYNTLSMDQLEMNPQQEESMRRAYRSFTGASDGNDHSNSPPRQHELGPQ